MTQIIKGLELNYIFEPQTKNKQIVAHNDLKTENVMIQFHEGGDDVTVKLIDYGLSTVISCQWLYLEIISNNTSMLTQSRLALVGMVVVLLATCVQSLRWDF